LTSLSLIDDERPYRLVCDARERSQTAEAGARHGPPRLALEREQASSHVNDQIDLGAGVGSVAEWSPGKAMGAHEIETLQDEPVLEESSALRCGGRLAMQSEQRIAHSHVEEQHAIAVADAAIGGPGRERRDAECEQRILE